MPTWRIVVFALITILVPLALAVDLLNRSATFNHTLAGVAGPTAAATALLLLLLPVSRSPHGTPTGRPLSCVSAQAR
jgi:hypothetical protein